MSGLTRDFVAYITFVASCTMIANTAISISYAFSCIFGSVNVATAVLPIMVIPLLAFGGFYINVASLPVYFQPLKYLSYFGYAFEIGTINQWTRIAEIPGCKSHATLSNSSLNIAAGGCYNTGQAVLESMNFHRENMSLDFISMFVMIIGFRLIAFIALSIRASSK